MRLREGIAMTINDSIVVGTYAATNNEADNDNYCLRIDNRSQGLALDGSLQLNSVLWSCGQNSRGQTLVDENGNDSGISEEAFATNDPTVGQGGQFQTVLNAPNGDLTSPTATSNPELQLLGGSLGIASLPWNTSLVDNAAPIASSEPSAGPGEHLGAFADGGTDWTLDWTYGIHDGNRGQALWIEGL